MLSERCITAQVRAAQTLSAEVHTRETVLGWDVFADGVKVRTDRDTYEAASLVITAGAWADSCCLNSSRLPYRSGKCSAGFNPSAPDLFTPARFPVFILQVPKRNYYGFPVHSVPGFKIGRHHHLKESTSAGEVDRMIYSRDEAVLRAAVSRYFPQADGPAMALKTCLYTNNPDEHFLLGTHPEYPQISLAAGFSGHGFKFCSVVGEIMAELAVKGETRHNIHLFNPRRKAVLEKFLP